MLCPLSNVNASSDANDSFYSFLKFGTMAIFIPSFFVKSPLAFSYFTLYCLNDIKFYISIPEIFRYRAQTWITFEMWQLGIETNDSMFHSFTMKPCPYFVCSFGDRYV
jgi:hypothetical protein